MIGIVLGSVLLLLVCGGDVIVVVLVMMLWLVFVLNFCDMVGLDGIGYVMISGVKMKKGVIYCLFVFVLFVVDVVIVGMFGIM